jgi:2-desacetyl-2-hydroxyethyl bacteriochlorophyllide A dehydrogenase
MKAAIFDAPHEMRLGSWPTPESGSEDVVIAVNAAGICAGDLYIYSGKNPYAQYPIIGGHEVCGTVVKVGSNVHTVAPGQLVVIEPFLSCGKCYPCRVGKPNCCANLQIVGVHRSGGYAEYVMAPAANVHRVPNGVSAFRASFAEPITIGLHACQRGQVSAAEYVLVLGCGPIGLAIIEVALDRKARVVATDVVSPRLDIAQRLGAETLKADEKLMENVFAQTGGEGAPVVIEATGNPSVIQSTVDLVAAGGRIVIVGLVAKGVRVSLPGLELTRKEVSIFGSRTEVGCFPEALALLASDKIKYPEVATEYDLWSAPAVFAEIARNPSMVHKGVFVLC